MANCTNCGAELKDGVKFCTECGAVAPEAKPEAAPVSKEQNTPPQTQQPPRTQHQPQHQPQQQLHTQQTYAQPQPQPMYQQPVYAPPASGYAQPMQEQAPGPDSPYGLISTWGFIGIMLLLCFPIIGFILMIVWACGGCKKLQKRNFCRAMLIVMAVSLVFSLILGFAIRGLVKSVVNTIEEEIGISEPVKEESEGGLGGLLGALFGESTEPEPETTAETSELDALSGLLDGLFGDLMSEVEEINNEAAKHADGWPSDLPDYPDGTMDETEEYRTLITGSSAESMWSYIETLKKKGYEFQDFYQMGMSEADMKSMNAWWGTNGKWYLSISYAEGTVTIDHTTELPDMSGLFG